MISPQAVDNIRGRAPPPSRGSSGGSGGARIGGFGSCSTNKKYNVPMGGG